MNNYREKSQFLNIIIFSKDVLLVCQELHQVFQVLDDVPAALGAEPHLGEDLWQLDQQPGQVDAPVHEAGGDRVVKIQSFRYEFPAVDQGKDGVGLAGLRVGRVTRARSWEGQGGGGGT